MTRAVEIKEIMYICMYVCIGTLNFQLVIWDAFNLGVEILHVIE
jgi:hypothetical protein